MTKNGEKRKIYEDMKRRIQLSYAAFNTIKKKNKMKLMLLIVDN